MTQLLNAEIEEDGVLRPLTRTEVLTYTSMIAGAGNETTTRLIGFIGQLLARTSRPAAAAGRGLLPDPAGDRGGVAIRGAVTRAGTVRRPRHRMPRREDPRGLGDVVAQRFCQPRRTAFPRRRAIRHPPHAARICRSGRACTSVSVRRWRGCRHGWRSRRSSSAGPNGRSTTTMRRWRTPRACGDGESCPSRSASRRRLAFAVDHAAQHGVANMDRATRGSPRRERCSRESSRRR